MSDDENVIRVVFNTQAKDGDAEDLRAMDLMEKYIHTFMDDPPDSEFQLGYLFCAIDLLAEMGGRDYSQLGHTYAKRMLE